MRERGLNPAREGQVGGGDIGRCPLPRGTERLELDPPARPERPCEPERPLLGVPAGGDTKSPGALPRTDSRPDRGRLARAGLSSASASSRPGSRVGCWHLAWLHGQIGQVRALPVLPPVLWR